jgi:PAT family beta-lactamase induction signal transducer AmpG
VTALSPTGARHPFVWVPSLYVAEALPFVGTMMVSVLMYKSLGLSDGQIAMFTSLVAWPWSLKPLWSGFMERAHSKRHLVAATQIAAGVGFALIAFCLPSAGFVVWSLALFAFVAFASASHDIAADGLYIESLRGDQQAQYIGYASGFWNVGRVLAQGGLVWIAGRLEIVHGPRVAWGVVMGLFAAILILLGLYHWRVLPAAPGVARARVRPPVGEELREVVVTFFRKKHVLWGLAFVVLYRFAEGQAMKILPLFLRADREKGGLGLPTDTVGLIYGIFGALACIAGAILGGHFASKRRLQDALLPLCLIFNLPYLAYVALAFLQPTDLAVVSAAVVVEWFGYGFGFVAVTLFMMQQLASGAYRMSHYAIATSAMNLGLLLPGTWSGWLSDWLGYRQFFLWVMASTLVSIIVASRVPFKTDDEIACETPATHAA